MHLVGIIESPGPFRYERASHNVPAVCLGRDAVLPRPRTRLSQTAPTSFGESKTAQNQKQKKTKTRKSSALYEIQLLPLPLPLPLRLVCPQVEITEYWRRALEATECVYMGQARLYLVPWPAGT